MSIREDLELLDQTQHELEFLGDELEETHGIDRRDFVFWSLVTAAASTFGFGASALAQAPTTAPGTTPPQAAPLPPLGNGEPVSWTFQPYPERHRRADGKAHQRARRRGVPARDVHRTAVDRHGADRSQTRSRSSPRTVSPR